MSGRDSASTRDVANWKAGLGDGVAIEVAVRSAHLAAGNFDDLRGECPMVL